MRPLQSSSLPLQVSTAPGLTVASLASQSHAPASAPGHPQLTKPSPSTPSAATILLGQVCVPSSQLVVTQVLLLVQGRNAAGAHAPATHCSTPLQKTPSSQSLAVVQALVAS